MSNTTTRTINQHYYDTTEDYKHNNNNNNNNYNNRHTEPGVCISAEDGELIVQAYSGCIGPLNMAVANMIEHAIKSGLSVDDVLCAIEETAFAPRPSAAYLRAILRNWIQYGHAGAKARHASQADQQQQWWQQNSKAVNPDRYADPDNMPF